MAQQPAYNANKGTLVPGQTISVNKFTVQVDRYLSQGGFAHVYLVRTPAPVYGTMHHVLKRIAVPNESMLSEVKKEVDIMRILKGHPNIVHLIDAAWHRMSNGMYEVFILMEFCAGGGIIDMMNRRLRERLTEAEILQIFVDVCEGVAAMHNLRPPLLHRDLKVENILQSSASSYKLCDFGSANPVAPRPPSSTQEIRALEADLNRHTTLQYRAPEMVDVYLRRPVDEKSDVWALGVLLYKLCYYTTPFEEHGPLAILNVQYKIPPYPVYSAQLNALIGSMLREHGAQRPSVFEILNAVHRMRGTKSKFTYDVPARAALSPHAHAPNPLDSLVSYRSSGAEQAPPSTSPNKNAGVQAREKVLEAIAPMRRGRPMPLQTSTSRPGSPSRDARRENRREDKLLGAEFDHNFGVEEDETWRKAKNARGAVRGHRSGLASPDAWKTKHQMGIDDAWDVGRSADKDRERKRDKRKTAQGPMETGFGKGFGDSFDGMLSSSSAAAASSAAASMVTDRPPSKPLSIPSKPVPSMGGSSDPSRRYPPLSTSKSKDAFDGLGLYSSEKPPAPTLEEVRQARTGLAAPTDFHLSTSPSLSFSLNVPLANAASRPSSRQSPAPSPVQPLSWRPSPQPVPPKPSKSSDSDSAEERFPSLEQLDRVYQVSSPPALQLPEIATPPLPPRPTPHGPSNLTGGLKLPPASSQSKYTADGVRSQQVTGAAMRESRRRSPGPPTRRPALERRHRSSTSIRPAPPALSIAPPSAAEILGRTEPQDWLTGDDAGEPGTPRLRDSPSKRASVIERSPVVQSPQEAVAGTPPKRAPSPPSPSPLPKGYKARMAAEKEREREKEKEGRGKERREKERPRVKTLDTLVPAPPVASRTNSGAEKGALTENWSPVAPPVNYAPPMRRETSSSSGGEEGPEDVDGFMPKRAAAPGVFEFKEKVGEQKRSQVARAKGRQSSVHDLVDLWGGGPATEKEKKEEPLRSGVAVNGLGAGGKEGVWGGATKEGAIKETEELKKPVPLSSLGMNRSASPQPFSRGLNMEVEELKRPVPLTSVGARSASSRPPSRPPSRGPSRPPSRGPSRPPSRGPTKETEILRKPMAFSPLDTMRSASPQPSTSPAEPPEPATRVYSPIATRHRKQSTTSISSQAPISPVIHRPRPQSLFISPGGGKPAPLLGRTTTATATATLVPPPDSRAAKSERRTSISNMVQRFEAMGGKPIVPATSTKPITKVVTHGTSSAILSGHTHAPSPVQARSRSHFGPGASLDIPDDGPQRAKDSSRGRTSPTGLPRTTPVGLPGLASDSRRSPAIPSGRQSPFRPPPASEQFQRSASPATAQRAPETPSRSAFMRSASPAHSPQKTLETPSRPTFARSASPAPAHHAQEEVPRSPSPEKPYQGVGRLIDQWQRKTGVEDGPKSPTAKRSAYAPKRAAVVGGKAR